MLVVLVERRRPVSLLRLRIDLHRAYELTHSRQDLTRYGADGAIRRQRDAEHASVTVLGDGLVAVEIQCDGECTRAVGCRQRARLPATHGQT